MGLKTVVLLRCFFFLPLFEKYGGMRGEREGDRGRWGRKRVRERKEGERKNAGRKTEEEEE